MDEMEAMERVNSYLEARRKLKDLLWYQSNELTLEELYEGVDPEAVELCHPELMQSLMDEIDRDLIAMEYYHLVVYALGLYRVSREGGLKTPCKTIQDLSGHHLAEVARKAGLKWRQVQSLVIGEGSAQDVWKLVVAFDWLGCQISTLWRSYVVIIHVSNLAENYPNELRDRCQALFLQLTTR